MPDPADAPNFDTLIDRSGTASTKWEKYAGRDVLPFWVADMDFAAPDFIRDAVAERLRHPLLGYTRIPPTLTDAFRHWLARHFHWEVPEEWLVWLPGVVPGLNLAARAVAVQGGSVLVPTPVYYPFLAVPENAGQHRIDVPLVRDRDRWVMDFDRLEAATAEAAAAGADSRLLLLCNPQNPTGRAYTRAELARLANFCVERDLVLCSDEIHCNLLLEPAAAHIPVASLGPEIAHRSISLYAVTKTYNIPGLSCAVAVIPDARLRRAFSDAQGGLVPGLGPLEIAASTAGFADRSTWLPALLEYLRGNRALVQAAAGTRMTAVEATYLAWIDVRDLELADPGRHFEEHGLGLSDGAAFGGPGFVRLNFGCPRPLLERGLERLEAALCAASSRSGKTLR